VDSVEDVGEASRSERDAPNSEGDMDADADVRHDSRS
jgi:hypothetical protein